MPEATWQDVAVALGRPTSDFTAEQQAQITHWLGGIEIFIRARLGDLSALDQPTLKYVEIEAVAAKVPPTRSGETSITIGVDDGNLTRRWEKPVVPADITDEWWEALAPARQSMSFSTRPGFARDVCWPAPDSRFEP